ASLRGDGDVGLLAGGVILSVVTMNHGNGTAHRKSVETIFDGRAGARQRIADSRARHGRSAWAEWRRQVDPDADPGNATGSRFRQRVLRRRGRSASEGPDS